MRHAQNPEALMKQPMSVILAFLILFAVNAFTAPGPFKKGDSWEYASLHVTKGGLVPGGHVDSSSYGTDSTIGTYALSIDSVKMASDSTLWYFTETTHYVVTMKPYGRKDSTYSKDTAFHLTAVKINNVMHDYIDYSCYFWFDQMPDTSTIDQPQFYKIQRATVSRNLLIDNVNHDGFLRILSTKNGHISPSEQSSYSSADTLLWVDSLGLCRRSTSSSSWQTILGLPRFSESAESLTLIARNGKPISMQPAAIRRPASPLAPRLHAVGTPARVFDIQGRIFGSWKNMPNRCGVVIRQFPDGRCRPSALIH
jgi:hypothetical protein